jgi:hypothetical protein
MRPSERSELRLKYLEDTRYARVSLRLLSDSANDGPNEWDEPTTVIPGFRPTSGWPSMRPELLLFARCVQFCSVFFFAGW